MRSLITTTTTLWHNMATRIEILDSNLNLVTWIKNPVPLNSAGDILQYSKELSDFGQCKFRVSSFDSSFTTFGYYVNPHKYHVRINRNGDYIWQGAIIENSRRNKDYIEVIAAEYLWYLGKKLIHRTSNNPATGQADNIYRIFNSGTMAAAVTAILNETITDYTSSGAILGTGTTKLTVGTVENPNYPPNMTDGNGNALTGAWSFGNGTTAPQLTFDFHSVLYVLKSFGQYTYADFNIDSGLAFNFKKFLGNNHQYSVNFTWGRHGNAVDFNFPLLGEKMVNHLWGIAVDNNGKILNKDQSDITSIKLNGEIEGVAAYADIKDQATLNARIQAELPLISLPTESPWTMTLDEHAIPLGVYDIGDIITVGISHTFGTFTAVKRVVGISVNLHNTGREIVTVQLNTPLQSQYGAT